jgi:hypothetical protein
LIGAVKEQTRMYISRIGIGDRKQCVELVFVDLEPRVQRLLDTDAFESAVMQVFYSADELEEEGLPIDPVLKATGGIFPVVWIAIGQRPPRPSPGLAQLEQDFQLELIDTFSPAF